jgi:Protein of unknown function (DUF3015)
MKTFLFSVVIVLGSFANAATSGYGESGCGLGSIIFGADKGFTQVFAATTNGSSYSQLFGISSGTSNCVDAGAVKGANAVPAFIETNTVMLAQDAAKGQGENLNTLAHLMGCSVQTFAPSVKQNYKKIFVETQMNPSAIESQINLMISKNKNSCQAS